MRGCWMCRLLGAMDHAELEEGDRLGLDFRKLEKVAAAGCDVVPVVVQNADSGEVLILGYANELALKTAFEEKKAVFWSTSRNELWIKGKTSGDFLELVDVRVNCEQNSLLYLVRPAGQGSCHTKGDDGTARSGCYYRSVAEDGTLAFVEGKR